MKPQTLLLLVIVGVILVLAWKMYNVAKAPIDLIKKPGEKLKEWGEALRNWRRRRTDNTTEQDRLNQENRTYETERWFRQPGTVGSVGGVLENLSNTLYDAIDLKHSPQGHKTPLAYEEYKQKKQTDKKDQFTQSAKSARYGQTQVADVHMSKKLQQGVKRERVGLINYNNVVQQKMKEMLKIG